jgi:hypothetical protein
MGGIAGQHGPGDWHGESHEAGSTGDDGDDGRRDGPGDGIM